MAKITTAAQLAAKCKEVAQNYKTLYVLGAFGWPMTAKNKTRALNHSNSRARVYNSKTARKVKINAAGPDTFGFDCVCMIKALLWGWNGNQAKTYGGAVYKANDVPDIGADQMISACSGVSTDFSTIEVGEAVWFTGHIGVYIGDGLAVECTPRWKDGVQITAVHNIGKKTGYNGRKWTKHGKLPYVTYTGAAEKTDEEGYTMTMRNLKRGCKGEDVRALQILLKGRGYNGNMNKPDGVFGPNTEGAVKLYQKAKGLTVDGIAGPITMGSLIGVEGTA